MHARLTAAIATCFSNANEMDIAPVRVKVLCKAGVYLWPKVNRLDLYFRLGIRTAYSSASMCLCHVLIIGIPRGTKTQVPQQTSTSNTCRRVIHTVKVNIAGNK